MIKWIVNMLGICDEKLIHCWWTCSEQIEITKSWGSHLQVLNMSLTTHVLWAVTYFSTIMDGCLAWVEAGADLGNKTQK